MKEMNWTRDEALKRLAILLQGAEKEVKETAVEAVLMRNDEAAFELFKEARDHKAFAIGLYAAADMLGISIDELRHLELDADEAETFMREKADSLDEQMKAKLKNRVKVVGVDEMPDELKDILKSILD